MNEKFKAVRGLAEDLKKGIFLVCGQTPHIAFEVDDRPNVRVTAMIGLGKKIVKFAHEVKGFEIEQLQTEIAPVLAKAMGRRFREAMEVHPEQEQSNDEADS
jgi:hypothetical protein